MPMMPMVAATYSYSTWLLHPFTYLNFDAKMNNGQVYLSWTTTFESNSSRFEIERSLNGLNFEKIGSVKAAINSSVKTSYQFVDDKAPVSGRKLFYRLKMVDLDASFSRSRVAVVDLVPDSRMLIVYPSPADRSYIDNRK